MLDDYPCNDINQCIEVPEEKYLYYGNLPMTSPQYRTNKFIGLALNPTHDRERHHDCRETLPYETNSIPGVQSEDVFEHVEFSLLPGIFDDIYRVLKPGGVFRLSLPDYGATLLKQRSVYDHNGNWLCDLAVGGSVKATYNSKVEVSFAPGGDSHLWAPTFENVSEAIERSDLMKCSITWYHYWEDKERYVCKIFDQSLMPVSRCPPKDDRMGKKPISLIVDFRK